MKQKVCFRWPESRLTLVPIFQISALSADKVSALQEILSNKRETLEQSKEELATMRVLLQQREAKLLALVSEKVRLCFLILFSVDLTQKMHQEKTLPENRHRRKRMETEARIRLNFYLSMQQYFGLAVVSILIAVVGSRFLS